MSLTTADQLTPQQIQRYQTRGFIHIPNVISKAEAEHYRQAALASAARLQDRNTQQEKKVFSQHVNVWQHDETMKALTLHPNIAAVATKLAGVSLRLWHDHILIKPPHNQAPTHYHQDGPYWPHDQRPGVSLSAWVALVDVPVERGCMTFIPGQHTISDLRPQNLRDERDLMGLAPEMQWQERVTVPLRAGDCTFHHQFTPHMANANVTDDPRVAHVIIYMAADTRYTGKGHPVTDPLDLTVGEVLDHEIFPRV
jgi:ectoine hydroxylase-related dioxygenase (phytanoyl-CoA dioxygenase family)